MLHSRYKNDNPTQNVLEGEQIRPIEKTNSGIKYVAFGSDIVAALHLTIPLIVVVSRFIHLLCE